MFEIISVTARRLCREPFEARMEKLAASGASRIILREKDMEPRDYAALAVKCREICGRYGVRLIAHTYAKELLKLGFKDFHMPLPALESFPELRDSAAVLGVSVHSEEQARRALELGATYLTAGHIFETDCKRGAEPRGVGFLRLICGMSPVPVYAIGGINAGNIRLTAEAGAAGACVMSGLMTCPSPAGYTSELLSGLRTDEK